MSRLAFELFDRYVRYVRDNLFSTTPDPLSEYSDAEQRRQAMLHSFEILPARDGGFDEAAFLQNALNMITSIWTGPELATSRPSGRC